jgi:hypothetical protein
MSAVVQNQAPTPASIDMRVDQSIPRFFVTIRGPVTGHKVGKALAAYYLAHPEVIKLDMLFDLTAYEGAVEADHVMMIIDAYHRCGPDPLHPCRTAFVTPDKNFRLWAAAMSFQFKGREHQAFSTFEEAEAFLAEPMDQRPPFEAVE